MSNLSADMVLENIAQQSFQDMYSADDLVLSPSKLIRVRDLHDDRLNQMFKYVNVWLLNYADTSLGTHKGLKAQVSANHLLNRYGSHVMVFGNFGCVPDEISTDTDGSGMDAFETIAMYSKNLRAVGIEPREGANPRIEISPINPNYPSSKHVKARIIIPEEGYMTPSRQKEIYLNCIRGDAIPGDHLSELYQSESAVSLRLLIQDQDGIDPSLCSVVTNLSEMGDYDNGLVYDAYGYDKTLFSQMLNMDMVIGTAGSAERMLAQAMAFLGSFGYYGPDTVIVSTTDNVLNPYTKPDTSLVETRLGNPFSNDSLDSIRDLSMEYPEQFSYMVVPDNQKSVGSMYAQVLADTDHPEISPGITGSMALGILHPEHCQVGYDRLHFKGLHVAEKDGYYSPTDNVHLKYITQSRSRDPAMRGISVPKCEKANLCFVLTGESSLGHIQGQIAQYEERMR